MSNANEQRIDDIKRQAQEMIDQAYTQGYKKAEEDYYIQTEKDRESSYQLGIEVGRKEAWEASRYCVNLDDAREYNYAFDGCIAKTIFEKYTASEAIEKIRAYEQKKEEQTKLKPCPFCGGTDINCYVSEDSYIVDSYKVGCCECGCTIDNDYRTKEEAIAAWNKRAGESE